MTFLSQRFDVNDAVGLDLTMMQTLWIEILMGVVFTGVIVA